MKFNTLKFHPKNKHQKGYDFTKLCKVYPLLNEFVFTNKYQTLSIDFSNANAVKALNSALLFAHYHISFWDFPDENLCPPIPSRVDYVHQVASLLELSSITKNAKILDLGTGASCIYPLLGNAEYGWQFIGTDIDQKSLRSAQKIIDKNNLSHKITLRFQPNKLHVLKGIVEVADKFEAVICNPPFHNSSEAAQEATKRKLKGLGKKENFVRNFGGKNNELWYIGGEKAFIHKYLYESSLFKKQCFWYSSLVSKKENLKSIYTSLKKLNATIVKTIPMHHGNKITRIVVWTFLNLKEQKRWRAGI